LTPGSRFSDLVQDISRQTRAIKASREYLAHSTHMSHMARLWDMCPQRYNRVIGPHLFPVMSLISNVNLSEFLAREITAGFVIDYHRFTGTGILTPMMAGLTTVGSNVNLTSTRHTNVFSADEHAWLMHHVERRLLGSLPEVATKATVHASVSPQLPSVHFREQRHQIVKEPARK